MMLLETSVTAVTLWQRFWAPEFPVYRNALLAGTAIGLTCGVLSVFVVSKRMAFIGQGISHSAFGGAGLAYLLALFVPGLREPLLRDVVVAVFCVGTALVIGRLALGGRVSEDAAIGIALVAAMALGVILLDVRYEVFTRLVAAGRIDPAVGARAPFHDLLFGNLLNVTREEVWLAWGVAAVVLGGVALFFKELVFFAFDSEGATVFGVPARAMHYGLLILLAATILVAMRMLGVILASAFLVLPATIALLWSRRMGPVMAISVGVAVGSLYPGLVFAMWTDFTVGPIVVLALCVALAASYAASRLRLFVRPAVD